VHRGSSSACYRRAPAATSKLRLMCASKIIDEGLHQKCSNCAPIAWQYAVPVVGGKSGGAGRDAPPRKLEGVPGLRHTSGEAQPRWNTFNRTAFVPKAWSHPQLRADIGTWTRFTITVAT